MGINSHKCIFHFHISFLYQGELHKHCSASHEVEVNSYKEYAAQIQPVKKPSNVSQCGWEPFGKGWGFFLFGFGCFFFFHNNDMIFIIRLFASCCCFFMSGGIQEMCMGGVLCFPCSD